MSRVIDQTQDLNGQDIYRIVKLYGCPVFVKEACQNDVCGADNTPQHLFADPTRKNYPCHSAAATWMSTAFFYEKKAELAPEKAASIEERLLKSADYFRIRDSIDELRARVEKAATVDETQLQNSDFAVIFDNKDGVTERHCPMRNALEVKAAATWLMQYRDEMPYDDRKHVADKILNKAASFGADISEHRYDLEKTAGIGVCSAKDAAALIRQRLMCVGHNDLNLQVKTEMEKAAALVERDPSRMHHHAPLLKMARVIDVFDRMYHLNRHYGTNLQRPEDILFSITEKIAAELSNDLIGSDMTGNFYKRADLERVPLQSLADSLGDDFADAVGTANAWIDTEKLARVVPTLPRGDAELFDAVVAESGVPPFAVKSATAAQQVSPIEQAEFASQHQPNPGSLWSQIGQQAK